MKFSEAREKLQQIANGRFFHISYEEDHHTNGKMKPQCAVGINIGDKHVNSYHNGHADTWEEAFENLEKNIAGEPETYPEEQAPDYEGAL